VNTDKLIKLLVERTRSRGCFTTVLLVALAGGVVLAGCVLFLGIGFRLDISQGVHSFRFLLKSVVSVSYAGRSASQATSRFLRLPNASSKSELDTLTEDVDYFRSIALE
jgi:hypothetical protein